MKLPILLFILSIVSVSCNSTKKESTKTTEQNIFKYAKNIASKPGSNEVTIYFNWNGTEDSITYILVPKGSNKESNQHKKIFYIETPISKVAALSTTHIAMIQELQETKNIVGTCDHFRMSNKELWDKYNNNLLTDLGTSMDVNQELLIELNPDAVFKTAFSQTDFKKDEILHTVKIPIIYTYSWHEQTPLARAEWIKFFGLLYGKEALADSVFNSIETKYTELKNIVDTISKKPLILAGDMVKDHWYMPGGGSYIAKYISDAGGNYQFKNNTETGSIPMNFENVLEQSQNIDIWIGGDADNFKELFLRDVRYELLPMCKTSNCYNHNARENEGGGNDYWETGYMRPDLILSDLIKIFHPEVLPEYELVFYKKIE